MSSSFQTATSVRGNSPELTTAEITAPVRLEGQTDTDVLFQWLITNRYLWMLEPNHDAELERIVGSGPRLRLGQKLNEWKRRPNAAGHPALAAPEDADSRRAAFVRLERLIEIHLFDSGDSKYA